VVELTPKDSSILTRIARYRTIPAAVRRALLKRASPKAREVGEIILGASSEGADADTKAAADAYVKSLQQGRSENTKSRGRNSSSSST
jgi:hypothetical protein